MRMYGVRRRPTPEERSASAKKAAATRAMKKKRLDEVAATLPPVRPGDIFYTSWGYDQTNVDFYEVLEVSPSGKTVKVVEIGSKRHETSPPAGSPNEYVVPDPASRGLSSKILTKQLRPVTFGDKGWAFKVYDFADAYQWDGQPKYQTGFGWGH